MLLYEVFKLRVFNGLLLSLESNGLFAKQAFSLLLLFLMIDGLQHVIKVMALPAAAVHIWERSQGAQLSIFVGIIRYKDIVFRT